jgi:hypothetical protein
MPPTPFMETFEDEGQISPDYDRLLDDDNIEDVEVSSELPSKAMLDEAAGLPIIDAEGKEMLFKNLYTHSYPLEKKRVMVIFVRHFFCGVSYIIFLFFSNEIEQYIYGKSLETNI